MMARSSLFGRRIHIAGSISSDPTEAPAVEVERAREFVAAMVPRLVERGATFVVPVDDEKPRPVDQLPICFDWLVWQRLHESVALRPSGAPNPLAVAVQHHKTEAQVPAEYVTLWDGLRGTDLVQIENVSHWNMASKRLEAQAGWGDILLALGGSEGTLFLANLYHDAGKPVVPLNNAISPAASGARRLFALGLSRTDSGRLFRSPRAATDAWVNRINFPERIATNQRVEAVINLLEALEPRQAFVVRLLNAKHPSYGRVEAFFANVVQPIVEDTLGYKMAVVDGRQPLEYPRMDQEIFAKLHRSSVVLCDLTGQRPNCFLELGYALGRGLPTMVMAMEGEQLPFDLGTFAGFFWNPDDPAEAQRRKFMDHWNAIQTRPPLVPSAPLIP